MICGVFGLPRAGKTTFLTWCAMRALKGKSIVIGRWCWRIVAGQFAPYKNVYTNFAVDGCKMLDFDKLGEEDFTESLILIDEIMLLCDSRDWKNFPIRLRNFLALHGHGKTDIIYCSQGYKDTDIRFRNLTENIFYIQRSGNWSKIAPIAKSWRIDQDIEEGYTLSPPIGCTWIFQPLYRKAFDSFDLPYYKPNTAVPWSVPACSSGSVLRCSLCALSWRCAASRSPAALLRSLRSRRSSATTNSGQKKSVFVIPESYTSKNFGSLTFRSNYQRLWYTDSRPLQNYFFFLR